MRSSIASAPGKIILLGEHAVVYGQPALAVPVGSVCATAEAREAAHGDGIVIQALDLGERFQIATKPPDHALTVTARLTLDWAGVAEPDVIVTIHSTIPIASGLGSGAAVSAAMARALAAWLGKPLDAPSLSALVFEVEKLHHGTPSGIDNTVICYELPVFYIRGEAPQTFTTRQPLDLLIADTGIRSSTKASVGAVRELWQNDPKRYEALFAEIGQLAQEALDSMERGEPERLGGLMNRDQELLRKIAVSSPELERLIDAALQAGASGAKLSGGGRGGNMIALVDQDRIQKVGQALIEAGAVRVLYTQVR